MLNTYFYHSTIKRVITVFGTLFNNINIVKRDSSGNVFNQIKVPLAWAPRRKFIDRIREYSSLEDANKVAIKLPRMSFEMTSLTYDPDTQLGRQQRETHSVRNPEDPFTKYAVRTYVYVPYKIGLQLNIYSNSQDDVLQITEQIIPYFRPDFSVTIKSLGDGMESIMDVPFSLQGISPTNEYEGDLISRNVVMYSLDFEAPLRFYGPFSDQGIIHKVIASFKDSDTLNTYETVTVEAVTDGTQGGYTIEETITDFFDEISP